MNPEGSTQWEIVSTHALKLRNSIRCSIGAIPKSTMNADVIANFAVQGLS